MNSMQKTMMYLDDLGKEYGCELYLPPFNNTNCPFFKIDELKKDAFSLRKFLIELKSLDISYKFVTIDGRKDYIQITMKTMRGRKRW